MTFTAIPTDAALTERHRTMARRFWAFAGGSPYAVPASKSSPRRRPGDAAVQDPPPRLDLVLAARGILRGQRAAVAGPVAMTGTPTPPRVLGHGHCGYTADYLAVGPKGSPVWIVRDLATREELAVYPAADLDMEGAILRLLREREAWRKRVEQEMAS